MGVSFDYPTHLIRDAAHAMGVSPPTYREGRASIGWYIWRQNGSEFRPHRTNDGVDWERFAPDEVWGEVEHVDGEWLDLLPCRSVGSFHALVVSDRTIRILEQESCGTFKSAPLRLGICEGDTEASWRPVDLPPYHLLLPQPAGRRVRSKRPMGHVYADIAAFVPPQPIDGGVDRTLFCAPNFAGNTSSMTGCQRRFVEIAREHRLTGYTFIPFNLPGLAGWDQVAIDYLADTWPPQRWIPPMPDELSSAEWIHYAAERFDGHVVRPVQVITLAMTHHDADLLRLAIKEMESPNERRAVASAWIVCRMYKMAKFDGSVTAPSEDVYEEARAMIVNRMYNNPSGED